MFFQNEKDYKNAASGLRRELKALGAPEMSHNQVLELLARSMGHANFSALKAVQPVSGQPVATATAPAQKPYMRFAYDEEAQDIAEREAFKAYRLFNKDGSLDLTTAEGDELLTPVNGLTMDLMGGTLDDIWYCVANVNGCTRENTDGMTLQHEGGTSVNWDGQKNRCDTRGVELWADESCNAHPADTLVLVKDGYGALNLLSEEVLEDEELALRHRDHLVDTCERFLRDHKLVEQAIAELEWDEEWGGFSGNFAIAAEDFGTSKDNASALGQAQYAAGFAMHLAEFKTLRTKLLQV